MSYLYFCGVYLHIQRQNVAHHRPGNRGTVSYLFDFQTRKALEVPPGTKRRIQIKSSRFDPGLVDSHHCVLCLSPYVCLTKPSSLSHSCLPLTHPVHPDSTCSGAGHAGAELGASPPCLSYRRGSWLLPISPSSNEREVGGLSTMKLPQLQPPPRF